MKREELIHITLIFNLRQKSFSEKLKIFYFYIAIIVASYMIIIIL